MSKTIAVLACCLFLTIQPAIGAPENNDAAKLEGKWLPAEAEIGGQKIPLERLEGTLLTLSEGKYIADVAGERDQGTYKIDATKKPKEIDVMPAPEGPNKGRLLLAIYEWSDDSLRICYELEGGQRPTEFKTAPNSTRMLVRYKRRAVK